MASSLEIRACFPPIGFSPMDTPGPYLDVPDQDMALHSGIFKIGRCVMQLVISWQEQFCLPTDGGWMVQCTMTCLCRALRLEALSSNSRCKWMPTLQTFSKQKANCYLPE